MVPERLDPVPANELPEAGEASAPESEQSIGDFADPTITNDAPIGQAAGDQGREASGEAFAVPAAPAGDAPCP